jgi:hypothetical protein
MGVWLYFPLGKPVSTCLYKHIDTRPLYILLQYSLHNSTHHYRCAAMSPSLLTSLCMRLYAHRYWSTVHITTVVFT